MPVPRPGLVLRSRLAEQLGKARARGVILACAPAGYGKMVLVADWARRTGDPAAWLSLDAGDNDPARLWRQVVAELVAGRDLGADPGRPAGRCDEGEGKDWTLSSDSTVARAHQHAAGARRVRAGDDLAGGLTNDTKSGREAIGRSRGGLTTTIHLTADLRCRPIARLTSCGQHGDCPRFFPLMDAIRIPPPRPGPATAAARPRDGG